MRGFRFFIWTNTRFAPTKKPLRAPSIPNITSNSSQIELIDIQFNLVQIGPFKRILKKKINCFSSNSGNPVNTYYINGSNIIDSIIKYTLSKINLPHKGLNSFPKYY